MTDTKELNAAIARKGLTKKSRSSSFRAVSCGILEETIKHFGI